MLHVQEQPTSGMRMLLSISVLRLMGTCCGRR
jgi:hypothetical protein